MGGRVSGFMRASSLIGRFEKRVGEGEGEMLWWWEDEPDMGVLLGGFGRGSESGIASPR